MTQNKLILGVAIFYTIFYNWMFFSNVTKTFPVAGENIGFLISLGLLLIAFIVLLLSIVSSKWTTKPILILVTLISSLTAYFMDTFHVVIDELMIANVIQTDMNESMDLLTLKQVGYFIILGVLPSFIIYKIKINYQSFIQELISKLKAILLSLASIAVIVLMFSQHYTSFFREHSVLRYYTNPTYWIYSIGFYINRTFNTGQIVMKHIGLDAKVVSHDKKRKLTILVVGEAARADRFGLNGYKKDTNPLLKKENIVNLSNLYSCGTSTAESVPCMFSIYDRSDYSYKKGISTHNVLDVLKTAGVQVLWRDNNSDSKGVALRVEYQNYKSPKNNTMCKGECRDEGMLVGLDSYINTYPKKDILIVLHQMGNHGPAYYKRYPKEFEKFTPVCKNNQLQKCKQEEISNSYDNAILYTDYFLSRVINFLKSYSTSYQTSMIYMSDHGESLGENGLYLHGLPYFMAPDTQTHIAGLLWFGDDRFNTIDGDKSYSHDNLFHTLLGLYSVKTKVYNYKLDILNNSVKGK